MRVYARETERMTAIEQAREGERRIKNGLGLFVLVRHHTPLGPGVVNLALDESTNLESRRLHPSVSVSCPEQSACASHPPVFGFRIETRVRDVEN